jgi:hypothetical protein
MTCFTSVYCPVASYPILLGFHQYCFCLFLSICFLYLFVWIILYFFLIVFFSLGLLDSSWDLKQKQYWWKPSNIGYDATGQYTDVKLSFRRLTSSPLTTCKNFQLHCIKKDMLEPVYFGHLSCFVLNENIRYQVQFFEMTIWIICVTPIFHKLQFITRWTQIDKNNCSTETKFKLSFRGLTSSPLTTCKNFQLHCIKKDMLEPVYFGHLSCFKAKFILMVH